jgi:hypothetical protein
MSCAALATPLATSDVMFCAASRSEAIWRVVGRRLRLVEHLSDLQRDAHPADGQRPAERPRRVFLS